MANPAESSAAELILLPVDSRCMAMETSFELELMAFWAIKALLFVFRLSISIFRLIIFRFSVKFFIFLSKP